MIVVRVELWPAGDEGRAELLGDIRIWNRTFPAPNSVYEWVAENVLGERHSGRVEHVRVESVWVLLRKVMGQLVDMRGRAEDGK